MLDGFKSFVKSLGPGLITGASDDDPSGKVFHTYSTYARGIDLVNTAYNYLDLTLKGRNESRGNQFWIRRHDGYT